MSTGLQVSVSAMKQRKHADAAPFAQSFSMYIYLVYEDVGFINNVVSIRRPLENEEVIVDMLACAWPFSNYLGLR